MPRVDDLYPNPSVSRLFSDSRVILVNVQWFSPTNIELMYKSADGKVAKPNGTSSMQRDRRGDLAGCGVGGADGHPVGRGRDTQPSARERGANRHRSCRTLKFVQAGFEGRGASTRVHLMDVEPNHSGDGFSTDFRMKVQCLRLHTGAF